MAQTQDRTQPTSPADTLQDAINLAKAGRKGEACEVLRHVVAQQPMNQAAWLWLSAVTPQQAEAEAALAQARKINPAHPSLLQAEQWLINRFSKQPLTQATPVVETPPPPAAPVSAQEPKSLFGIFSNLVFWLVIAVIVIGLIILFLGLALEVNATTPASPFYSPINEAAQSTEADKFFEPSAELDQAWAKRDWTRAITLLEELHQVTPTSSAITDQLSHAYIQQGIALRHKGFIKEALTYFEQALAITPNQLRAQQESRLATSYLAGIEAYQAGQWPQAIAALESVRAEAENYVHVNDLLYSAYYNQGLAVQAAGQLAQAQAAFEAAIVLRPDLPEPRRQMAELQFALAPQTPLSTPISLTPASDKLILVGIAEQRMRVYEGKREVFDFIISTGEPGSDTAIGEFEILNKIDIAYGSTWNLDMPYWLGIYWSGPLQNGIHALPIVKHTGYKLWDGYLGQRVSYGCVILGDEDAATLYEWADVGTKVKIVPSLAHWSFNE